MNLRVIFFLCAACATGFVPRQAAAFQTVIDLDDEIEFTPEEVPFLDLEQLLETQVVTLGVHEELFHTPAAVTVITNEEIRRSGHRTLAELIGRLDTGTFVGQINSQQFSVGVRGFNGSFANKTLVLIDGRSVYDPLFSGTFWNVQDVLLEDIERIEVIRGPGPTLWGENAVNGVFNVITKSAKDTQGWFINGGGGSYERAFGSVRYGMALDDNSWLRVYGKWFERDHLVLADGSSAHDDWDMARTGFRFDQEGDEDVQFTLQGDAYYSDRLGEFNRNVPIPDADQLFETRITDGRNAGANMLFRLSQWDQAKGWSLQGYYDRTERLTNVDFEVERDTFDLDFRHGFSLGERNEVLWGVGARHTRDRTKSSVAIMLDPANRSLDTFSAFVQDTITLEPDRWFAMFGAKFSHNDYTGFEVQPSARLWWTPNDQHTLWGAVSRPVRVPSRLESEGTIVGSFIDTGTAAGSAPSGEFVPLAIVGNKDLDAEELIAYELGHRVRVNNNVTLDSSLFYNDYDDLIYVPATVFGMWNNDGFGETYGGEISATWEIEANWRVKAGYNYAQVLIHGPILSQDETLTPHHQAQLRSFLDVTEDVEFNSALYFVDNVPAMNVPSYLRLDLGVTWHVSDQFDLSMWGFNLLDPQHPEFSDFEVERSFYLMGTLRF